MEHSYIDKYGRLDSPIHRLDPRVKIICAVVFVLCAVTTPPFKIAQFAVFFLLILAGILFSRVPAGYVFRRSLAVIPFVLLVVALVPFMKGAGPAGSLNIGFTRIAVSYRGLWIAWNVLIKSWLAILATILLSSTTDFQVMLKGLELMRVPRLFIMILAFMYRYIFIISDEAMRMQRAHRMRYFGGRVLQQARVMGNMIGLLFIRSYERGERIYQGMCARGFDGEIRTINKLKFTIRDAVWLCSFLAAIIVVKIIRIVP